MSEEVKSSESGSLLGVAALILVSAGWVVSVLLGDGLELHRSAFATPFVVLGALCGLVEAWRFGHVVWKPALVAGALALIYFAGRAILSPVWDLARYDLNLVVLAWLTVATIATCLTTERRVRLMLAVLVAVFAAQLMAGLYQRFIDPEFVFFRLARKTNAGVSGLFWHWNNLAGFLAIVLPVFLGIALSTRRGAIRILFVSLVLAGLLLAYFSKSRAGFASVVVGLGSAGVILLFWRSRNWSWSARLAIGAAVMLAGLLAAVAVFSVASGVSAQRGHGKDVSEALGKSMRLSMSGAAFDQWMDAPLTGTGSQSFKYLVLENWDGAALPVWLGSPETVHNEYLQVLCDYGLIGFVLIMGFLLVVLGRVLVGEEDGDQAPGAVGQGVRLGAAGGLVGGMFHAVFDFQLHLLPILLLVAIAVGILLQKKTTALLPRAFHGLTVIAAVVLAIVAVGRENLAWADWLRWELNAVRGDGKLPAEQLADFKALIKASPHYESARAYGRIHHTAYLENPDQNEEMLKEAAWGLKIAYERNEFDQLTLVNYALVLDRQRKHEYATEIHQRAVKMAGARENKFGARAGLADNLYYRGQQLWMARKSSQALGYYLRALEYLEASRRKGYSYPTYQEYLQRKRLLNSRITLLQTGGIQPQFPGDVEAPLESQ